MKMIENETNVAVPLEIVKASDIEPKEVKWLWYPYIPFGKVTLLQGDPGDGKSKFMLSLAALPCLAEQQKIADCFLSLDEVIEKQKATLTAWEELKKGLLQQMFV